jgi:hypothetical protein
MYRQEEISIQPCGHLVLLYEVGSCRQSTLRVGAVLYQEMANTTLHATFPRHERPICRSRACRIRVPLPNVTACLDIHGVTGRRGMPLERYSEDGEVFRRAGLVFAPRRLDLVKTGPDTIGLSLVTCRTTGLYCVAHCSTVFISRSCHQCLMLLLDVHMEQRRPGVYRLRGALKTVFA